MLELILFVAILLYLPLAGASPAAIVLALGVWAIASMPGAWLLFRGAPPFVPTPKGTLQDMLELADIRAGQKVYDIGCGDGRLVVAAAAKGADAVGYELSVPTYLWAKIRSLFRRGARIRYGDFWKQSYGDADVIFCYLIPSFMDKFFERIWPTLRPGTRVVSHDFPLKSLQPERELGEAFLYRK
jgi:SAM-dependent methyltransferase